MNSIQLTGDTSVVLLTRENTKLTVEAQAESLADLLYSNLAGDIYTAFVKIMNDKEAADKAESEIKWISIEEADQFYDVRLELSCRILSYDEIMTVSGLLGYAFASTICGEGLSQPNVVCNDGLNVIIEYGYDSTKSQRSDWHNDEVLQEFENIVKNGSRIRSKPRAVAGTRKCKGLGFHPNDIKLLVK